jgi:hypothetical protein
LISVQGQLTMLTTISANLTEIVAVGNKIADVSAVAADLTKLDAIFADLAQLEAIYTNLAQLEAIYTNLDALTTKLTSLQTQKTLTGVAPANGASVNLPLGSDAPAANVAAVSVRLTGTDGSVYFPDGTNLIVKITGTNVVVSLGASAPAAYTTGALKALVSYTPSA